MQLHFQGERKASTYEPQPWRPERPQYSWRGGTLFLLPMSLRSKAPSRCSSEELVGTAFAKGSRATPRQTGLGLFSQRVTPKARLTLDLPGAVHHGTSWIDPAGSRGGNRGRRGSHHLASSPLRSLDLSRPFSPSLSRSLALSRSLSRSLVRALSLALSLSLSLSLARSLARARALSLYLYAAPRSSPALSFPELSLPVGKHARGSRV